MSGRERHAYVGETALFSLKDACRIARDRGAAVIGTDHVVLAIVQAPIMKDAMWQMTETLHSSVEVPSESAAGDLALGVESSTGRDVFGVLREAQWHAFGIPSAHAVVAQWSDQARDAVYAAVSIAVGAGDEWADRGHLLKAVFDDVGSAARRVLGQCGVEPAELLSIAADVLPSSGPPVPVVDYLRFADVLTRRRDGVGRWRAQRRLLRSGSWFAQASDILAALEIEAVRQAVRLAHSQVTSANLVLAVLSFDEQMAFNGDQLPREPSAGQCSDFR